MSVTRLPLVVVGFVAAGAAAGVLWERLWHPTAGLTYDNQWYLEPAGPDIAFQGVALFVLIAFPLGVVLMTVLLPRCTCPDPLGTSHVWSRSAYPRWRRANPWDPKRYVPTRPVIAPAGRATRAVDIHGIRPRSGAVRPRSPGSGV